MIVFNFYLKFKDNLHLVTDGDMLVQVSLVFEYVLTSNTVIEEELLMVLFIKVLVLAILVIFIVYIL